MRSMLEVVAPEGRVGATQGRERKMSTYRAKVASAVFVLVVMTAASVLVPVAVGMGRAGAAIGDESEPTTPSGPYPFRDFSTVVMTLEDTEAAHPDICRLVDIGDGWEKTQGIADRDILAMRITDNPDAEEDEPDVLFLARQHADENVPTEIALQLIENLTDRYGSDVRVSWLVDNRDIWIIPVVNPDGMDYFMSTGEVWRKNRHLNYDGSYGVDLNRNYNGSENGDPLGAWGGVGASSTPSDWNYCGEFAFSEPETQAVRDLALSQGFEVAIDFHMAGDVIAWPWGYTFEPTPDDADLVEIALELSKVSPYFTFVSAAVGLTTGDSLDWLYGGADVYPFLFEVGGWVDFVDPEDELDTVRSQIEENILPSLRLIEIAGDRSMMRFDIMHTPISDALQSNSGFEVCARISAERGLDPTAQMLRYRVDGGPWTELVMTRDRGNSLYSYSAVIPSQRPGSIVDYYIAAHDNGGVELLSPTYAPYEVYSFCVISKADGTVAEAGDDSGALITEAALLDVSRLTAMVVPVSRGGIRL